MRTSQRLSESAEQHIKGILRPDGPFTHDPLLSELAEAHYRNKVAGRLTDTATLLR